MSRTLSAPNLRQVCVRALLPLAVVGVAAIALSGCVESYASVSCRQEKIDVLHVGKDGTCSFHFGGGDLAKYVIVVTRAPAHGQASGQGKFLQYVAQPGFVGEDRMTIEVDRRVVGHVQWQTHSVTVKVGPRV
jgi:hypothetical protein